MGASRILGQRSAGARITRITSRLVLLSVPVESTLEPLAHGALTKSEKAVVGFVSSGLSNAAIARRRSCSPRTIANQLAAVYRKLGVRGRRELKSRFGR